MFHFKRKRNLVETKELERKKQGLETEQRHQKLLQEIKESVGIEKEFAEKMYMKQKKQHLMLEELLEVTIENENMKETTDELLRKQETDFNAKEELLVNTILKYDEYLYQMERQSKKENDSWNDQLHLIHTDMKRQLSLCGIQEIIFEQEKADPFYCHIIETIPTTEQDMDNKISETISPGYVYHGKIKKKLKVTIYKFKEN